MKTNETKAIVSESEAYSIIAMHAPNVRILEVVSDTYADLDSIKQHQEHEVPGFFQVSSNRFEIAPLWNLRSDDAMRKVLEQYAITPNSDTRILLYDNIQINCGKAKSRFDASSRMYSVLKYFGVKHVSVIMDTAMDEEFEDEYSENHPEIMSGPAAVSPDADLRTRSAATFHRTTQVRTGQHAALIGKLSQAATNEVHLLHPTPEAWSDEMVQQAPLEKQEFVPHDTLVGLIAGELGGYKLLDARSFEEHEGGVTGYEYVDASGRIPTSESFPNADYQLSPDDPLSDVMSRLQQRLTAQGIAKDDRLIWYCGTGWRAARMCILSQAAGYTHTAVYEGGWNEWYRRHPEDIVHHPS